MGKLKSIKSENNVSTLDVELAIMKEFNFRQNLIVPNITNITRLLPFETDILILTKDSYATGFEIKISKSDLNADFKKRQHNKDKFEKYYGKFKHFYYAVPEYLKEYALNVIPDFCGLWVFAKYEYPTLPKFYEAKKANKLFDYKFSDKERYEIARLGTMRIYSLKQNISLLKSNNN